MADIRYVAQVVFEALTPLRVGSGDSDLFQDAPVFKDFNNLPMIPGSSIAGVLRKHYRGLYSLEGENRVFGYQKENDGEGSRLIVTNAMLLDENGKVMEELSINQRLPFLKAYEDLPIRDHVKIADKGVSDNDNNAKFDEEVIFKGSRFKFELELVGNDNDESSWNNLLNLLKHETFRLGGGSSKGFGKLAVISCKERVFSFSETQDIKKYQQKSSRLDCNTWDNILDIQNNLSPRESENHTKYTLELEPDDFFMFGSGIGDDDADMTPVKEKVIEWTNGGGKFVEEQILIPASSIKGALSHRTAFHYNRLIGATIESGKGKVGEENEAVRVIFGTKKDKKSGQKGKILISDCFKKFDQNPTKVFDHVKIDRFTGGAIDGALFQEKTIGQKDEWEIEILLDDIKVDNYISTSDKSKIIKAFECALTDIATGMLPLGGSVNRGHGVFLGSIEKNNGAIHECN